ncbi:DUF4397 domain-containing protein [Chitinophaga barathri]|uniref:DUF4397 domain-containing protein n=1 Tax=Chitinophaga barathri TaxID=1647451 RepID=A0A3N4MX37_9BACT|nr:DUF4397 domain-containing protein [Chitinophaga barathri]RPD39963.1 hypothetical protein EG028_17730 [Chitinophaga barathri]
MKKTNSKKYIRGKFLAFGILLFTACEKTPEILQPEDSRLSFYNTSQHLENAMRTVYGSAPLSLDGSSVREDEADIRFDYITLGEWGQVMFPVATVNGTFDRSFPWMSFLSVSPGRHSVGFHSPDSLHSLLTETEIETRTGARSCLFLADSLGVYQTLFLVDESRAAAREARIRVTHLSPDAGPVELWVNGQQLDMPGALQYRNTTAFISWDIPENQADTLLRLQVRSTGTDILGRANLSIKPGETGHIIIYGYYNGASYEDPATGETVTISPDFKVRRLKYN